MDNQLAKEEPKQKRKVGMVAVRTILKHPRRYGFVDNEHAHRYIHGMSRDALVQVSTISDVDKGLAPADPPGADEANNVQDREQGESSVGQRNVIDPQSATGIRGGVSDKVAGKQPATSSSLAAQPASNQAQSSSFYRIQNPSGIRDEATQPQPNAPPPRPSTLLQSEPIAPKIPSTSARNESKPSQKKASWRDPPTAADDPDDPLSKFYATGTYTRDSRAAYRLSNISYAPSGQPDVMDLGSRILAKMSLVPQTKVFPRRAAVQPTQAAPNQTTTASFGQPTIGAHPPAPHPTSQLSLPPFHTPSMNSASSASSANSQANSGVSGQLSQHLPQGQANSAPSMNGPTSTQPAPSHYAIPPSIARAVPSANIVSRLVSVSSATGPHPTSSSGQVNHKQANTITWTKPEIPATFAASRGGMLPPIRPSMLAQSQTVAHASADLDRPLPASSSGKVVTAPSVNVLTDPGRPLPTSTSKETVTAAPDTNASTNPGRLIPLLPASFNERMAAASASNFERMAATTALHAAANSGRPLPAASSSRLATALPTNAPTSAPFVSRRSSVTPLPNRASGSNADQTGLPESSLPSIQTSSSSAGIPHTAPQLNTLVPGVSALSPASRRAMLAADYYQDPAPTAPIHIEQGVEAMEIDDQG